LLRYTHALARSFGLLLGAALLAPTLPTRASQLDSEGSQRRKQKNSLTFFEGRLKGAGANGEPLWLAVRGKVAYGLILRRDEGLTGELQRLQGTYAHHRLRMKIFGLDEEGAERQVGILTGKVTRSRVRGSLRLKGKAGTFTTLVRKRSTPRTDRLRGSYAGDLTEALSRLILRKKGRFEARNRVFLAERVLATGEWLVDTRGFLWLLPLKVDTTRPVPMKPKAPIKLRVERAGKALTFTDPLTAQVIFSATRE
jgi:hypothetical protein